jgi:predicted transcriptional regulator of viral defense system
MSDRRRLRHFGPPARRRGLPQIAAGAGAGGGEPPGVSHFRVGMRPQDESPARKVADAAARSHGVVAYDELIELGVGPCAVKRWAADGRLHRLYRGVYAVGHKVLTVHGRWMAAVKACGPGAVLSHISAAALWDLIRSSSPIVHVTTPGRASPKGIRVHRVRRLHPDDVAVVDQVPVTSVARILLDLADVLQPRQLIRAIEQAERLQIFDMRAIERLLARSNGRRVAVLRSAIAAVKGEPPRVNSNWERDLLDFCEDHGIPRPELNVIVEGHEVDALWRAKKIVVELDSWRFHRHLAAFVDDRRKIATLQLAGYLVLPLTKLGSEEAEQLSAAIAAR